MEIQHLKYFVDAIEYGSFAKAAEELYVTRQTISNAINQLENELGFALLIRNKNGVELTNDGEVFYDRIKKQFDAFGALQKEMSNYASKYRLSIKIGIAQFFEYKDVQYIQDWIDAHPEYHAELIFCKEKESIQLLEKGKLDFLLTKMNHEVNMHYTSEIIAKNKVVLIVHEENPLAKKTLIESSDLIGQTVISTDFGLDGRQYLDQGGMPSCEGAIRSVRNESMYNLSMLLENKGVMISVKNSVVMKGLRNTKEIPFSEEYTFPYFLNVSVRTMKNKSYHKAYRSLKKHLENVYKDD